MQNWKLKIHKNLLIHYKFDSCHSKHHPWYQDESIHRKEHIQSRWILPTSCKFPPSTSSYFYSKPPLPTTCHSFPNIPPPIAYYSPTCFIGTLEYTKITIFSILQFKWHGFSKRFYSRHKFMILSIKERYLVSVEHFLCYCSLLNF